MSTNNVVLNNGQQAIINTNTAKIFVWNNRYISAEYTNSTYDAVTIPAGTLMGRVHATGEVIPLASGASDGSQFPLGVLASDYTVDAGDTVSVSLCVEGDVVEAYVVLDGSDTMDTVISARTIRDRIGADTVGIKLVGETELTGYDNQ